MAKLFKKSTFLFVLLGLLALAKGHGHIVGISAASHGIASGLKAGIGASGIASGVKAGLGATGAAALLGAAAGSGISAAASGIGAAASHAAASHVGAGGSGYSVGAGGVGAGGDGCPCNDKFSEFMNKVAILLRYYTSKELGPELQALAMRFVEFFFSHLAAEKPVAMNKLHGFLQNSVHVTGAAVAKVKA